MERRKASQGRASMQFDHICDPGWHSPIISLCYVARLVSLVRIIGCHRLPERSFFYRGRQLPVCARCTGLALGYLAYPALLLRAFSVSYLVALLLLLPCALDGITQLLNWRRSNNSLRFITGVLCGIGQAGLLVNIGRTLAHWVLGVGM